ncbi:MAG: dual specificity protein phosphatase family protein [Rhodospirillales bacterium]
MQSDLCRDHFAIDEDALIASARDDDVVLVNAPMLDFNIGDQRRRLPNAVRGLYSLLDAGHRVYVHCTAGLNRAPLAVLGFLTFIEQQSVEGAMQTIRAGRPQADPSFEAYDGCRRDLADLLHDHIYVRAYYLSEEDGDRDADANWTIAERDVIRGTFVNPFVFPRRRLDPNREIDDG